MVDDQSRKQEDAALNDAAEDVTSAEQAQLSASDPQWRSWGSLWQIPTILISALLILSGVIVGIKQKPQFDYDMALTHVEKLIANKQFDNALVQLR